MLPPERTFELRVATRYVSRDRLILVTCWSNGGPMQVAVRDHPDAVWGPPVAVELER